MSSMYENNTIKHNMTVEAFIIAWNEEDIIGHTVRHYQEHFGAKVNVFDNYSTDRTREIATHSGAYVESFGTPGVLDDLTYLELKNNIWKNSHADWVIVCDADELLVFNSADPLNGMDDCIGACNIVWPMGWDVYSDEMPAPNDDIFCINTGYEYENYAKRIMFNRHAIKEINYRPGCHSCNPVGDVRYSNKEDFTLMHYKNIGGIERKIARNKAYQARMSKMNRQKGYGVHYDYSEAKVRQEWADNVAKCKPLW